jgi:aspartate/methionine/tyrosine aminotransferase
MTHTVNSDTRVPIWSHSSFWMVACEGTRAPIQWKRVLSQYFTFSKILAPGLRLGWIVAPAEVIGRLVKARQGADLHTSTLTQMFAYEVARGGFLDQHVRLIRDVYRERRDVMLTALGKCFPHLPPEFFERYAGAYRGGGASP